MKLFLTICTFLLSFGSFGQSDAPAVEWKQNDVPPHFPDSPIMDVTTADLFFQPGAPALDPSHLYPEHLTGEDWWYSIADYPGSEGYVACGFATWIHYRIDETPDPLNPLDPLTGCLTYDQNSPDLSRPILSDEFLSAKLATVARYDEKGNMIWCTSLLPAVEGAYSCKVDLNGDIIVTGWTLSTVNFNGSTILFNPQGGGLGDDLNLLGLCVNNDIPKMFVAKIDTDGELIWSYLYSMYDLNTFEVTDAQIVGYDSKGYDLVVDNDGNYVIVGDMKSRFYIGDNGSLFILKIDPTGQILNRSELHIDDHYTISRSISLDSPDGYLIGGYSFGHPTVTGVNGFVAQYDPNLNRTLGGNFGDESLPSFFDNGVDPSDNLNTGLIWIESVSVIGEPDVPTVNVVYDTKKLANNNIAVVSVEDCYGCGGGGNNLGIGRLRIYDQDGILDPTVNGGDPIRLNGNGYVKAFDMKVGIAPEDPNEITIIATVPDGDIFDAENIDNFAESMDIISNFTNTNEADFLHPSGDEATYTPRDNPSDPFDFNVAQTSALLANYSIDGVLRWEKVIDIDDAPLQVYPGDWKEQECVYQVMKDMDNDGAYIFVGNTSHNKDDYLIAKVFGNCQLDIVYDIQPPDPTLDNTVDITGFVTWDPAAFGPEIDVRGEIHVKDGALLIIKDGLIVHFADGAQMVYDTKLIVEPGGRVIVEGGAVLTSNDCPGAMWNGVEVWGDTDSPQTFTNQGSITMNNATISNAHIGVKTWKQGSYDQSGGIVRGTNSFFTNNNLDVQFAPYLNIHTDNMEHANLSFFNNCEFRTNDSYKPEFIDAHITLYAVSGVRILGCDFADDRTTVTEIAHKGEGIVSADAQYKVLGRFTSPSPQTPEYYMPSFYDVCTFTNLETGILAMNVNSQRTILVDHTKFTDCRFGVRLSEVHNALITRNFFEETASGFNYPSIYEILTQNCHAYQIEGNIIENNNPGGNGVLGITIDDSGLEDNRVYKNKVSGTLAGTYSFAKNKNSAAAGSGNIEGLEFLCNEFSNNEISDHVVKGFGLTDGEKIEQGTVILTSRNIFSLPSSGIINQLTNLQENNTFYYFNSSITNETPTLFTPTPIPAFTPISVPVGFQEACATSFTTIIPGPKPVLSATDRTQLEIDFTTVLSDYQNKKFIFEQLVANGDRQLLHDAVANLSPSNKLQVKNLLLAEPPFLSELLILELADQPPNLFPNIWLKDILVANIELTRSADLMSFLLEKASPMPIGLFNQLDALSGTYTERTIKQHEVVVLNTEKNRIANYIIKDITLDTLGIDWVDFNEWTTKRGDLLCEFQIVDNFLSQHLKDSCLNHLSLIDDQISALDAGDVKNELLDYRAFKTEMLTLTNSSGILEGLNENTESVLRFFVQFATGTAQVQAQNALCFFLGECANEPPLPEINRIASVQDNYVSNHMNTESIGLFSIYPNPTMGEFTIKLNSTGKGTICIVEMNGRTVYKVEPTGNKVKINLSDVESGIYLVQLLKDGVIVQVQKLVKQ